MNHLRLGVAQVFDGERHSALHAVEVVVDTQSLEHEQGGGDTPQTQLGAKVLLEKVLDEFNALLCLFGVEQGLIIDRLDELAHAMQILKIAAKVRTFCVIASKNPKILSYSQQNKQNRLQDERKMAQFSNSTSGINHD